MEKSAKMYVAAGIGAFIILLSIPIVIFYGRIQDDKSSEHVESPNFPFGRPSIKFKLSSKGKALDDLAKIEQALEVPLNVEKIKNLFQEASELSSSTTLAVHVRKVFAER